MRINRARDGLLKNVSLAKSQNDFEHALKRNLVGWHRITIRIREDSIAHFGKTRSMIGAILFGEGFGPEVCGFHLFLNLLK
jgi:hypothetical protein